MTMEHAPTGRRAFFSSFTLGGTQLGAILGTAVFLPVSALPTSTFESIGWRIPFWLSAVVVAVAYWIRRTLHEPPAFVEEQVAEQAEVIPHTPPLRYLGRFYVGDVVKVFLACLVSVARTIFSLYALTYGNQTMKIDRTMILWIQICGNIIAVFVIPAWATLADRIGRKPVFLLGALGSAVMIWPFIWSISQVNIPMMWVTGLGLNFIYSAYGGAGMALFSEQFETRVHLSGMAIGTQFGFALGGFAPTIAGWLAGDGLRNWVPVATFTCGCAVVASIASLFMRETAATPLEGLGNPRSLASEAETTGLSGTVA